MELWLVFTVPPLLFGLYAQWKVKHTFAKYSEVRPERGITGADAAAAVLQASGLPKLTIEPVEGYLSDHYDPSSKTLRLSAEVGATSSIAALGVAAHEAGHAIQDARGYGPMRIRQGLVPLAQLGSSTWLFPVMGGMILGVESVIGRYAFLLGIGMFGLVVLFQLVTLPVEFDASKRALQVLESSGLLAPSEMPGAKAVLNAAALTYVAAFVSALAQLLYFVISFLGSRD